MEKRGKLGIVATVYVLVACLAASAPAKVIYVDDDATGANDGSSWANAFVRLQNALAIAQPGDEVRVAQGRYRPDQDARVVTAHGHGVEISPSGLRTAAFQLENGVAIRGGFAGVLAQDPNVRSVGQYETILSGDLKENDGGGWEPGNSAYESLRDDNSQYVVESRLTDATAVLDGVTIQAALQSGMHNVRGSPRVLNCTFRQNSARNYSGGALLCEGGEPSLWNCVFNENSTMVAGGAIRASTAHLTLVDCRFVTNQAATLGGALCSVDSVVSLTGCTFERNTAPRGGAVYHQQGSLAATKCRWAGNVVSAEGGAISSAGGPLTLEMCALSGNLARSGGAIHLSREPSPGADADAPDVTMTHCVFTGNRCSFAGGAVFSDRVALRVINCTFADNYVYTGGKSLAWSYGAPEDAGYRLTLANCILWDGAAPIYPAPPTPRGAPQGPGAEVVVEYCDVQGRWLSPGNIDADPCFVRPGYWFDSANPGVIVGPLHQRATWADGDYHLKSQAGSWDPAGERWVRDSVTSPCIDAGDPKSPAGDEPEPNGGRINMGAYGGTTEASKSPVR
jgi:predicted outer membrane repeat protein